MENLFNELPHESTCELTNVSTTLSYLQHRYVIKIPNSNKVLSIILLANYLGADKVFNSHLKCDFAFLNKNMDKQLLGVRVFEGEFEKFKETFYKVVLPMFN